jgi:transposase-like protein
MKKSYQIKQTRHFSEDLRKQVVGQIERREMTVSQATCEYAVSSSSVYHIQKACIMLYIYVFYLLFRC